MIHPRPPIRRRHDTLLVAAAPVALALALAAGPVQGANNTPVPFVPPPSSGTNWSGATIDPNYTPTSTVNAVAVTAPRAYAEWQQFNVTAGSVFNVNGQNPDWILVNRVVGVGAANISDLSGTINAAGQVWLINPNGIVASQTGVFNVGGLLLSTATGFDTAGFLTGSSLTWTFTGATQPIVMNGTVVASHGVVALLAPQITVSGSGGVFETDTGQVQFVAIAAEDVSLTFAEDGNLLYQLDGATIEKGVAGSGPGIVGGVLLDTSSTVRVGRIFVAAAGQNAPANVLVTGSVTATEARVDGDDIVLMVTDFAPAGSPQVVADTHVSGGPNGTVHDQSVTNGGGYVLLDPQNVNTVQDPTLLVDLLAAPGAGVTVRSAGTVILGDVTNPVGDLDIKANGNIIPVLGKGNLSAVDIALESGGDITTGSLNARDDVVVRSEGGFTAGDINAGVTVLGLSPSDPTTTNASEAGERLVARTQPMVFIGHSFDLVGHNVDVIANHIDIGAATASDNGLTSSLANPPYSDVRLQTFGLSSSNPLNGGVVTGALTAPRDVLIDAFGAVSATDIVAGRDLAANSAVGDTAFASANVGDDIVLGARGAVIVSGDLTTHGQDSAAGGQVGDLLAASGPVAAYSAAGPGGSGGTAFGVTGSDIDILSGSIRIGGTALAQGGQSDARFQAQGAIALHAVTAGQDILIDGGQGVVTGTLTAGRDVAARSFAASVITSGIDAQDDVVLRAAGAITVNGSITTHGLDSNGADQAGDLLVAVAPMNAYAAAGPGQSGGATFDLVGSNIDVKAGTTILVTGLSDAVGVEPDLSAPNTSSARFQATGAITLGGVTAGKDILIDAGQAVVVNNVLLAGRDVAVRSQFGSVTITSTTVNGAVRAGDDVVLRAGSSITVTGRLATYGANDPSSPDQAGDLLAAADPIVLHGVSFGVANGANIDVKAGGSILVGPNSAGFTGFGSAYGGTASDVRFQAGGAITLNDAVASEDVLIDAGQAVNVDVGLGAGRDVAVRSSGSSVAVGEIDAKDDIVVRAGGAVSVAGSITTHGQDTSNVGQVGDLLAADAPLNAYSGAGPGQPGGVSFDVTGSDIDIKAGSISVGGLSDAQGAGSDARFQATGAISLAAVAARRDILIDGGQALTTGDLSAGRDIAARAFTGSVTVGALDAQDDVVLRSGHDASTGAGVTVHGAVTTHGVNDTTGLDQSGDLLVAVDPMILSSSFTVASGSDADILSHLGGIDVSGLIDAAGSARVQTGAAGGDIRTANVTAQNGDILLDGANVLRTSSAATNVLGAARRDVAVRARTGAVTITSASAGDDIAIRAGAGVTVSGSLTSGTGANAQGAGDELAAADPIRAYWAASPAAFTPGAGSDIDVRAGGPITLSGPTIANGAGSDIRLDSGGAVTVGTLRQQGGTGGEQVLIAATDLTLGGQIDAPSADVLLFARRTSLPAGGFAVATLGGPAASGAGFTFDNTEVSRTRAASLNLFSGADPAATSNVAVQDLQFTTTLRTIRVYAGQGSRIDVTGQVTDPAGTDGVFVIGAAATDPRLAAFTQGAAAPPVSTAWAPDVIRLSGGIGVTGNALSRVSFAAPSIYIAPTGDSALGADFESASQSQAPEVMAPYAGPATLQLRAGRLELRASNAILERNLQTTATLSDGRGLELGGIGIDRLSAASGAPARVSLFGRLDSHLGGILPPPPTDTFIDGIAAAFLLRFAPEPGAAVAYPSTIIAIGDYRFNTCEFGGAGCFQLPNPGGVGGVTGDIIGGIAGTILGGPSAGDSALEGGLPGIANPDLIGEMIDPFAPIEEEPVTNAGGEIEWPAPSTLERPK